jgi:hypothetical protein
MKAQLINVRFPLLKAVTQKHLSPSPILLSALLEITQDSLAEKVDFFFPSLSNILTKQHAVDNFCH